MMEKWNEERYKELNSFFRIRIQRLLAEDPYIKDLLTSDQKLSLETLVERMSVNEQLIWEEFIKLDRIKMQRAIQDHLEGKGTPFNPRNGLSFGLDEEGKELW